MFDAVEAAGAAAPLVHDAHHVSDNPAAYFGMRPQPGTNVCHLFSIRSGDVDRGFAEADVVVEETFRIGGRQARGDGAPRCARPLGRRAARGVERTQTPFNVRSDLASIFGIAEEQVRVVVPPMGGSFGAKTFVRLEAIVGRARAQGGPPGEGRAAAGRGVGDAQPSSGRDPRPARRPRRRDARRQARRLLARHGRLCGLRPGRRTEDRLHGRRPVPDPERLCRLPLRLHEPPPNGAFRGYGATQAVWASERLMDELAIRLGMDPLELRLRNVLRDGDVFCTGEIDARRQLRRMPRARAPTRSAGTKAARGKGLCVLLKGMQTPSRASIAIETGRRRRTSLRCATTEMGQGARRALSLDGRASCSASSPSRCASPTPTPISSPTTRGRRRAARPT